MKNIYLFIFSLTYLNSFSQCVDPVITWFQTFEYSVLIDGINNSAIDYYEIEYKAYETFTPGDGTAQTYTFSEFPHTITGLIPGTPYYFTNRSVCNDGTVSAWNDNGMNGPDLWYTNMETGEFVSENVLTHNVSQEITHEPSQICESIDAVFDFSYTGSATAGPPCPETTFSAQYDLSLIHI